MRYIKFRSKCEGFKEFLLNCPEFACDAVMALAVWGDMNNLRHCDACGRKKRLMVDFDECERKGPKHDGCMIEYIHRVE